MGGFPTRAMIVGGASSGKSEYGEQLVRAQNVPKTYVATAQAFDLEMEEKILAHKAARANDGWKTVEEPFDVAQILRNAKAGHAVLLDCATLWLSNILLAEHDFARAQAELIEALRLSKASVTIVSNEVGQGIVPETSLGREFRKRQGALNIAIAKECDLVVQVVTGIAVVLKGKLPDSMT